MLSDETLDQMIDALAPALGLRVDPAWREAVRTHLRLSLGHAALVADFPLPDEMEPAPVFTA